MLGDCELQTSIHTYVYEYACTYVCICLCQNKHTQIDTVVCMSTHIKHITENYTAEQLIHMRTYVRMHSHTQIHTHTHTHTHTQTRVHT